MLITTKKIKLNQHPKLKIYTLSDLHFRGSKDLKKFKKLAEHAKNQRPDAIILAGDVIDSLNILDREKAAVKTMFENFTKIAPVYVGFGNHDISEYRYIGSTRYQIKNDHKFREYLRFLESIDNLTPLHNRSAKIKDKTIYGLTLPGEYYGTEKPRKCLVEHPDILEKAMKKIPKADLVLIHAPAYINNPKQLTISGHMHGGILPCGLTRLPGTRGLISPEKKLFPEHARNIKGLHIILGPVTTFPETLSSLNFLFPVESAIIEL